MFIKTSIKTQLLALIPGQIRLLTFEILDRDYLFTHSKLNILRKKASFGRSFSVFFATKFMSGKTACFEADLTNALVYIATQVIRSHFRGQMLPNRIQAPLQKHKRISKTL